MLPSNQLFILLVSIYPLCPVCLSVRWFVKLLSMLVLEVGVTESHQRLWLPWGPVCQHSFKNPHGDQLLLALLLETSFSIWLAFVLCFCIIQSCTYTLSQSCTHLHCLLITHATISLGSPLTVCYSFFNSLSIGLVFHHGRATQFMTHDSLIWEKDWRLNAFCSCCPTTASHKDKCITHNDTVPRSVCLRILYTDAFLHNNSCLKSWHSHRLNLMVCACYD